MLEEKVSEGARFADGTTVVVKGNEEENCSSWATVAAVLFGSADALAWVSENPNLAVTAVKAFPTEEEPVVVGG